jgi:hypothetical protein
MCLILYDSNTVGRLSSVYSLTLLVQNVTILLDWDPPFTLNIPRVDPDIEAYCVTVDVGFILYSECVNESEFRYPLDGCYIYNFTVVALNVVGNGARNAVFYSGTEAGTGNKQINPNRLLYTSLQMRS